MACALVDNLAGQLDVRELVPGGPKVARAGQQRLSRAVFRRRRRELGAHGGSRRPQVPLGVAVRRIQVAGDLQLQHRVMVPAQSEKNRRPRGQVRIGGPALRALKTELGFFVVGMLRARRRVARDRGVVVAQLVRLTGLDDRPVGQRIRPRPRAPGPWMTGTRSEAPEYSSSDLSRRLGILKGN